MKKPHVLRQHNQIKNKHNLIQVTPHLYQTQEDFEANVLHDEKRDNEMQDSYTQDTYTTHYPN